MKINFFKPSTKKEVNSEENLSLAPFSPEDFEKLFSGQELPIFLAGKTYYLSMLDNQRLSSKTRDFFFTTESGVVIGKLVFSLKDCSWSAAESYKASSEYNQVLSQLEQQKGDAKKYYELSLLKEKTTPEIASTLAS